MKQSYKVFSESEPAPKVLTYEERLSKMSLPEEEKENMLLLYGMTFTDFDANLTALRKTLNNLEEAINELLDPNNDPELSYSQSENEKHELELIYNKGYKDRNLNLSIYRNSGNNLQLCLDELKRLR